jgi:hypothetical protein
VPADVAVFGGAQSINGIENRGSRVINPSPEGTATPAPYGGGNPFVQQPNAKKVSGGGANVGAGATDGNAVP